MVDGTDRMPSGAPFKRRSLVEQELVNSLDWLISLRSLAGAAVIAATLGATLALGLPLPARILYVVGAGILLYNSALWWTLG